MKNLGILAPWLLSGLVLLAPPAGLAASPGATVKATAVSYPSGPETVQGYLAKPAGAGPFPALVVIHEWWGLNDQVKEEARKLAEQGYVALALDLYRGHVTADPEEAHELIRGLPEDRARQDLLAAFAYLAARPDVRGDRIGSIGWCMGGGYSLVLAMAEPRLAAAVIYYGRLATDEKALAAIHAPIAGFFGEEDRGITPENVRAFELTLRRLGKSISVTEYPNAGHAFANATRPSYREAEARDAWEKTLAFLAEHLKGS